MSLSLFNTFSIGHIRHDILGGITAAIVSLPLALAFGMASGAGPETGLYGAIIVGFFAAVFGGTPTLISEPTGPMTVVMTAVVASMIAANPENGLAMAFTVVMIAGVFQIILGVLRLGRYLTLMPYSVISGFMSGIGVILILMQLPTFFGSNEVKGSALDIILNAPNIILGLNISDLTLGILALSILFLTPKRIAKVVPPQLIALVIGTIFSLWLFSFQDTHRIGEITFGWPNVHLPTFSSSEFQTMIVSGLMLGALGSIDSLLTAVISDSLTREEHKSDKELIGQGVANTLSGIFGGLPGAGATMGTVVNIQAGARTAWSGAVRALTLLVFVVGATQFVQYIPMAILAAIAIKVGINILDWSFVKRVHRISKSATLIMYSVFFLTIFVDLVVAVGVGMFIANLLTVEKLCAIQKDNIHLISDADDSLPLSEIEKTLLEEANSNMHTLVVYLSGPMIFGVSAALRRESAAIEQAKALVLDLSDVSLVDATISLAIENMLNSAIEKGLIVYLVTPEKNGDKHATSILKNIRLESAIEMVVTKQEAFERIARHKMLDDKENIEHLAVA